MVNDEQHITVLHNTWTITGNIVPSLQFHFNLNSRERYSKPNNISLLRGDKKVNILDQYIYHLYTHSKKLEPQFLEKVISI